MKRIAFNTWSGAFFNPGGGEIQLLNTKKHLELKNHSVCFYDQWKPQKDIQIFHQFSIQQGVEYPMAEYRNLGKKIALSTILWVEYPKDTEAYRYINRIFNMSDILFTNSDMESEKLARAFDVDLKKFHRTVNGISEEYLDTHTNENFCEHFKIKGDFFLSIANVDQRKNTHLLVKACQELGLQLVLIGHIRDTPYFEEFRNTYEGLRYLGPVTNTHLLKSALQQAKLFLLPSLCETPGIAALEAGSQGAKIVLTSEGSTREYFQDLVTYVNPQDLNGLIEGIQNELKTTRDPQVIRSHIVENFTWEMTANQVIEGYSRLT